MHFTAILLAGAATLLATTAPALATVQFTFYEGANCTGTVGPTSTGAQSGACYVDSLGSYRSIAYSGVPSDSQAFFYAPTGAVEKCGGTPLVTLGSGSGCATAPVGYTLESVKWK